MWAGYSGGSGNPQRLPPVVGAGCLPVIARNRVTRNSVTKSRAARHLPQVRRIWRGWTIGFQTKNRGEWPRHFLQCANGCTNTSGENPTTYRSVASATTASDAKSSAALRQTIAVSFASAGRAKAGTIGRSRLSSVGFLPGPMGNPSLMAREYIAGFPAAEQLLCRIALKCSYQGTLRSKPA